MRLLLDLIRNLAKSTLQAIGVGIAGQRTLAALRDHERDVIEVLQMPTAKLMQLLELRDVAKAQLGQDLFVLSELEFKRGGFFVEFGATDGVALSNTYLLETGFGWKGILAEPARGWHDKLRANRTCHIETKCVWTESNAVLQFSEVGELSAISAFNDSDNRGKLRKAGQTYEVKTISLLDLLANYNAPRDIDYLSIDTEGSEYEILKSFDFDRYRFALITCEHNFTPMREKILALLTSKGYQRKYAGLSRWDDWYVGPR